MIETRGLGKVFTVHKKEPGFMASLKSLVRREKVEKAALKDVTLHVGPGEILGLVGANGAGKTTLVKILSGIVHPSSGEARVLGFNPWERKNEFRRQIALLMGQKAQLWWDLPASDCFLLIREIYEIPESAYRERLNSLATKLGVTEHLNVQIRRLSLGERMKMELIACLLHEPRVVFLDEPTIGLDLTSQRAIRDFLLEYRKTHQPAMVLTSHYMEDIERLCERIAILREGRIVYDGPLERVMSRFAQHKVITARLTEEGARSNSDWGTTAGASAGEYLGLVDGGARFKVPRGRVAEAASRILAELPVQDLSIEGEDIGTVIEAIQRSGLGVAETGVV